MNNEEVIYIMEWLGFTYEDIREAKSLIGGLLEEFDDYNDVQKFIIENYNGKKMWLLLLLEEFVRGTQAGYELAITETIAKLLGGGIGG